MDVPNFSFFRGRLPGLNSEFNKKTRGRGEGEEKVGIVDENIWDPMLDDEEDDW